MPWGSQVTVSNSRRPLVAISATQLSDLASTDWFVRRVLGLLKVDCGEYEEAASTRAKARGLGDTSEEVALNLCGR